MFLACATLTYSQTVQQRDIYVYEHAKSGFLWFTSEYVDSITYSNIDNGDNIYNHIVSQRICTKDGVHVFNLSAVDSVVFKPAQLCPNGNHPHMIDLGLPSGTKWASCNVGATKPEEYGDYFAWGETEPKDFYEYSTYRYCNGSYDTMTKYCTESSYGYYGFTDGLTELLPEDDAATANWGGSWKMPTRGQIWELLLFCSFEWTQLNGVNGHKFTGSNGNCIFLPAAGYRWLDSLDLEGSRGFYWSRSLDTTLSSEAYNLFFDNDDAFNLGIGRACDGYYGRLHGLSVRPVSE